jgi:hypothetical protein
MVTSFGTTGPPRPSRPTVESTTRVAQPPSTGVAREEVTLLVDGVPQMLEIVRQERIHGQEGYWICKRCGALRWHLYWHQGELACRVCHKLRYRSKSLPRAVRRAAKLRRKLGAAPGLLSPVPPKPKYWSRAYYARLAGELAATESVIAEMLGATVRALERRKGRLHGPR